LIKEQMSQGVEKLQDHNHDISSWDELHCSHFDQGGQMAFSW